MLSLTRQLVALDMLCLEIADFAEQTSTHTATAVVSEGALQYLRLLKQFSELTQKLSETAVDYSDYQFVNLVVQSGVSIQFKNKRMLMVYQKLTDYVIEFYQITHKILAIRDSHFDALAEERLQLLQPRAIKAKSQFKTVAQALGKKDYQQFALSLTLPTVDWSWDALRLEIS